MAFHRCVINSHVSGKILKFFFELGLLVQLLTAIIIIIFIITNIVLGLPLYILFSLFIS